MAGAFLYCGGGQFGRGFLVSSAADTPHICLPRAGEAPSPQGVKKGDFSVRVIDFLRTGVLWW